MKKLKYFKSEKMIDLVKEINDYASHNYLDIVSLVINEMGEAAVLFQEIYKGD